ncbi:hypothetical protein, conserved [Plasmodium gonderi]|uniref:Uncharacterized protein n=1 Tax=Plasmodium gonderi TaxID=77519 RepID=A0A1Y1JRM3_PLAGO|nr:hypothetical protein, conserved [Plasmodium gonderi]GAW82654.1 hypothetical protein, conserved [Plasmodium gonderi]
MRKLLKTAIIDVHKINSCDASQSTNLFKEKLSSLIINNIDKFENEEIIKIMEKYNENNYKDRKILRTSYDVFKNNIHRYSFDQINKILKLYHTSQVYDNQFNVSIFSYVIKRMNAIPASVTINIFHNLVKSGLGHNRNIDSLKEHFKKNIDTYNTLDLTIILSSFTLLQEEILMNSTKSFVNKNSHDVELRNSSPNSSDYNEIITLILNKIKNDEHIHNNLSVVNSILILNMISRLNINNYDIFKFFTKKYYKNLKENDVEPHHLTLLLNSFAKCNININILKYIIKYMNNDNFINHLSYVNITNALHYMAKFNYQNKIFLNRLKYKVMEIIDKIPQREFSNIMWSLSKLKVKDNNFYFISLQKIKKILPSMDMMSIAQVLDALRRKSLSSNTSFMDKLLDPDSYKSQTTCELSNIHEKPIRDNDNINNKNSEAFNIKEYIQKPNHTGGKINSECNNLGIYDHTKEQRKPLENDQTKRTTDELRQNNDVNLCYISKDLEIEVTNLLTQKYMENIELCSLHVLTQVPFCCLQLDCTNYDIYHKSLEVLKRKRKNMSTLNLIYARYFIRILIEKQENNFQKLPRSLKQFAREIMNSDSS